MIKDIFILIGGTFSIIGYIYLSVVAIKEHIIIRKKYEKNKKDNS